MRNILNVSGDKIELNALFIQPSRLCAGNCAGCYVKEHVQTKEYMEPTLFGKLIWAAIEDRVLFANQITVSFDLLPEDDWHKSILLAYYKKLSEQVRNAKEQGVDLPAIHGTFTHADSFIEYKRSISSHSDPFDMVSISNLPTPADAERILANNGGAMAGRHINFNHQIPEYICSDNIDEYVKHMETIAKAVSTIYLVIHKFPVGKEMTVEDEIRFKNRLTHDLTVIHTLNKRLTDNARAKLIYDGCLADTAKFAKDGHGCSSNISRIQVWPDGSVTGCAYAHQSSTGPAETIELLIDNIRAVRKEYDFREKCYLPSFYLSKP